MNKRGNYFIAVYDKDDNNVMEFESIKDCAMYFQVSRKNLNDYILRKRLVKNEYKLFKIDATNDNLCKSL